MQLQPASLEIWDTKYRLKDNKGVPIDKDIDATLQRVAQALASVEKDSKEWTAQFKWAMQEGAVPAGRILSNLGAEKFKPKTSTINCTVSDIIPDSMNGIMSKAHEAALTLKAGCGIGYEFSTLRPNGATVAGAGAETNGPLAFMDIYDKMCFTVSSAGGRRGAQMATFDVQHPDVFEFIRAKREDGRFRQFNLSLLITDEFINAVKQDLDFPLVFPYGSEIPDEDDIVYHRTWPGHGAGQVLCKIYKTVKARDLWDTIMKSTYDFAEPGFILIDRVNKLNNNWFCEVIRVTNPCGEQPLPPYGACLLGSVNLTKFIDDPFTDYAKFSWERFIKVVAVFTRMLDNVVELNNLPLQQQRDEILSKRRHGMGYMGLGSAMAMLRMKYGSAESIAFTEKVTKELTLENYREGIRLAEEKGMAPILEQLTELGDASQVYDPGADFIKVKRKHVQAVPGLHPLHPWMQSNFMLQVVRELGSEWKERLLESGCRFTHATSIAPTGTIAFSMANNASNGIEPSFAHKYSRNVIKEGKATKEKMDVYSYESLLYNSLFGADSLPEYFINAEDVTPKQHIDVQAAAQKWIDSSISKTINVATDTDFEEFKDIYMYAYDQGLKGCTTFRFNPEAFQGVLVTDENLANTTYKFTLDDGETVQVAGGEEVTYEGESHTAANLYDALKEGYYGKH